MNKNIRLLTREQADLVVRGRVAEYVDVHGSLSYGAPEFKALQRQLGADLYTYVCMDELAAVVDAAEAAREAEDGFSAEYITEEDAEARLRELTECIDALLSVSFDIPTVVAA